MKKGTRVPIPAPPYEIPTMDDVCSVPYNGFNVMSTFTGAGGSCIGFRLAGFKTIWAMEFVQAARETYAANFPEVPIDERDIRTIDPEAVLKSLGLKVGDVDVLEGSPPCSAFSTAGKIQKGWGKSEKYSETRQRVDDLFWELARFIGGVKPKVFLAENVKGLISGKAVGYFLEIKNELQSHGYKVAAKLLDAQWLGVPQHRERVIFIGVREDLDREPVFPKPLPYRYGMRDALPGLTVKAHGRKRRSSEPSSTVTTYSSGYTELLAMPDLSIEPYAIGKEWEKLGRFGEPIASERYFSLKRPNSRLPSPTITQAGGMMPTACVTHPTEPRKFTIEELKRLCSFPHDFVVTGSYNQQWERLGRAVPPLMMRAIAKEIANGILGPGPAPA